jgi:hypothetical protein
MQTRIDIYCSKDADSKFAEQIRLWAEELIDGLTGEALPNRVSIRLYHLIDELRTFFQQEKKALGVVSEGEAEFIATHEAWRGYPRIHICSERIKDLSEIVVQGAVQHELAHAVLHGTPVFYTFQFSPHLITAGKTLGLDMQLLQQFVYLLSIALKDAEVIHKLVDTGFDSGQIALLEHMLADTHAERSVWDAIQTLPPQRKIAIALFMKILLPLKTLASIAPKVSHQLLRMWENNYDWIREEERRQMSRFAAETANHIDRPFQNWLEQTALNLIADRRL